MNILKLLGIVNITHDDGWGRIHLKLALDLFAAIRSNASGEIVEDKARNIIQVVCEPMFDNLIEEYGWSCEETQYADDVIARCIEVAMFDLLEIARRRLTHKNKRERQTKLHVEDMKLAASMTYIMDVHNRIQDELEDMFISTHGGMYFST